MRIAVSGRPGAGKSTLARALAARLKLRFYSIGDMRRQIARSRGLTIAQLNKLDESSFASDRYVDTFLKKLGRQRDNFVIDSRLAFAFVPRAIKLFVDAAPRVRAARIFRQRRVEEKLSSTKAAMVALRARERSDRKRYAALYGIDPYDKRQFDFVLDTTKLTRKQALAKTLAWLSKEKGKGKRIERRRRA